ncbi:MAG: LUD domain-containing protein, partial [Bacteroidetes bacterium]|nr:LUD domain-containing protein [Bacteroidota bacterium]
MTENQSVFLAKSGIKAHDLEHKRKINFNIQKYNDAVVKGKQQFANLDLARRKAKNVKWKTIENLDKYLETFEKNFTARGGKVIWAEDADEALQAVLQICESKNAKQ